MATYIDSISGWAPDISLPNMAHLQQRLLSLPSEEPLTIAWRLACTAFALYSTYLAGLVVYRLTLHPLARFPGPLLCRISYLPQAYYEAILQGKFIYQIPRYHEKYGALPVCWFFHVPWQCAIFHVANRQVRTGCPNQST